MKFLQEFIADNLSGFSVADIPNYLFAVFLAAFWAFLLGKLYLKGTEKSDDDKAFAKKLIVMAMATAVIITIIRYSIPLAIGFAALLTLVRFKAAAKDIRQMTYLYLIIGIGIGAGAGYGIVASIGYILIAIVLWLSARKS